MPAFLLDSGILIRHLRRLPGYESLLLQMSYQGDLFIASFTRIGVIQGMQGRERQATYGLLDAFLNIPLKGSIADLAGERVRSWKAKGFTLAAPDAIIAATAISLRTEPVTTNARHFPRPELAVWQADSSGTLERRG
jgi:predicted nucleic acid-binding protein